MSNTVERSDHGPEHEGGALAGRDSPAAAPGAAWTELRDLHIAYAANRDPALRSELLDHYGGLVTTIVNRYAARASDPDDVHQVAMIGLLKALDRYDPERGVQFSTF